MSPYRHHRNEYCKLQVARVELLKSIHALGTVTDPVDVACMNALCEELKAVNVDRQFHAQWMQNARNGLRIV